MTAVPEMERAELLDTLIRTTRRVGVDDMQALIDDPGAFSLFTPVGRDLLREAVATVREANDGV